MEGLRNPMDRSGSVVGVMWCRLEHGGGVKWLGMDCPRRCRGGGRGRTARRRYGGRAGRRVGRTAARGCGGAKGEVVASGAAAEERDDGELVLAGVRAAMATAFRGLGARSWRIDG
jgi:hypothetical protein